LFLDFSGNRKNLISVVFSPDGKYLAFGSGKKVKLWNLEWHKEVTTLNGHKKKV
jgi:WD40 repeat protein